MRYLCRYIYGAFLFLSFTVFSAHGAQELKWSCAVPECADCSVTVDLDKDEVEFKNKEALHSLKQTSKTEIFRSFLLEPDVETSRAGYRALFLRDQKMLALYEVESTRKEKILFTGASCKRKRR